MATKTITTSGLNVGDTATLFYRKSSADTANESSYTRTTESDSSSKTWQISVELDVSYTYSIRIVSSSGVTTWPTSGATFTIRSPYVTGIYFQYDSESYDVSNGSFTTRYDISASNPDGISYDPTTFFNVSVGNSNPDVIACLHDRDAQGGIIRCTIKKAGTSILTVSSGGYSSTCTVTITGDSPETPGPDEPDEPNDPIFSLSLISTTMVTASVTNIKQASVTLQVLNASGNEVSSKTMDFNNKVYATISITTDGLTPNTFYTARVLVDGVSIGTENFTTKKEQESVKIYDIIVDYTSVDIYLEDCPSSSSVSGVMTHDGDIIYGTITFLDDYMCCISFTSLHPGVTSVVDIVVGSASTQITVTTLSYPMFKWTTLIGKGMEMNMYDSNPAPVTADEWNRLLDLIELKLGKIIPYVSQGDEMIAGSGGNIRVVADALGVSVDSGWTITAQFFLDLQDAINNK